jgi:hypothetical protein
MTYAKPFPFDHAYLSSLLNYDPTTGVLTRVGSSKRADFNRGGRRFVSIDGRTYLAHRVAWFLSTGRDPGSMLIDHKDFNPSDNRIDNLRPVDKSKSAQYRVFPKSRTRKTLTWVVKVGNRFRARHMVKGELIDLGYFQSELEAHLAVLKDKIARGLLHYIPKELILNYTQ